MMQHVKSFKPSRPGGDGRGDFSDIFDSIIAHMYLERTLIECVQAVKARPADRMVCSEVVLRMVAHSDWERRVAQPADGASYGHHLK